VEQGAIVPVEVEGLRGPRFVLSGELELFHAPPEPPPSVAFLAPLDSLVWDRHLLRSLFDFDYVWEVYTPVKSRKHGYYVLPVLWGDRLVGRIEPRIDRKAGVLRVPAPQLERRMPRTERLDFEAALERALEAHRRFSGAARIERA
jgi:uncharacterized protein YcaQ